MSKEYSKAWYERNKERCRLRYERNREALLAYGARYYERNSEECKERTRAWKEENENPTVYLITHRITGNRYVGSTLLFKDRRSAWRWTLRTHNSNYADAQIQKDYDEYDGWRDFDMVILEENIAEDQLRNREQWWIEKLQPEYNLIAARAAGKEHIPISVRKVRLPIIDERY